MMVVQQLPRGTREFAVYLRDLLARVDQRAGWAAVFWQRDPDGMRACLDGVEVPPWDVVEALLTDLAHDAGPGAAAHEMPRARALHRASLRAYDSRPGSREALGDRLDQMLREQSYAAERRTELARALTTATSAGEAEGIRLDLAWAADDHTRATARCAELRSRIEELAWRAVGSQPRTTTAEPFGHDGDPFPVAPEREPGREPEAEPEKEPAPAPKSKQRPKRRTRGSARFAGMMEEVAADPAAVPGVLVDPAPAQTSRSPRGARFAGAAEAEAEPRAEARPDDDARRVTVETVRTLMRLRAEGRGGEAHGVLVEAAYGPADRFPLLAAELQRAGLGADWATLLWEAASLPPDRMVTAATALAAAGRAADGEQMLRQGVVRPAEEIGEAALGLLAEGRRREARSLLDAYVRTRTPEEAARSALPAPDRLVPLLLEAARSVSQQRHWDLLHAVRVAGLAS